MTMPLSLGLTNGIPPVIGKRLLLSLENGKPVTSLFATIPATTLADGCDPPRISCMKKENEGSFAVGFAVTGVALGTAGSGTSVSGGGSGTSASGCGSSSGVSSVVGLTTGGMSTTGASFSETKGSGLISPPETGVVVVVAVAAGVIALGEAVIGLICCMVVAEGMAAPGPGRLPIACG